MITIGKFFGFGLVFAALCSLLRLLAANVLNTESVYINVVLWLLLVAVAVGTVRRVGIINYLEAGVIAIIWFLISLGVDGLFTSKFIQPPMFSQVSTWVGYLVAMLSIFFFHRKRHVEIRREFRAKS